MGTMIAKIVTTQKYGAKPLTKMQKPALKTLLLLFDFFQASRFALESAQIIQLGAANFG